MLGSIPAGSLIKEKKRSHVSTIDIVALIEQKKKTHLGTSYDFVHLADLAPVVQKINNPISTR